MVCGIKDPPRNVRRQLSLDSNVPYSPPFIHNKLNLAIVCCHFRSTYSQVLQQSLVLTEEHGHISPGIHIGRGTWRLRSEIRRDLMHAGIRNDKRRRAERIRSAYRSSSKHKKERCSCPSWNGSRTSGERARCQKHKSEHRAFCEC